MAPEEYIEKIKQMVADGQLAKDVAEKYFPELIKKVSEDERVLNEIIEYLKALRTTAFSLNQSYLFLEEWIAWLEKQAEQKPAKDFKEGTNWYRNNVWHDTSEKPEERKELLVYKKRDCDDSFYTALYSSDNDTVFINGRWYKLSTMTRWAYLEDLLPDTKGGES